MPEIGGDCLDIHAVLQRKRGIGVAEIMEAHFWQAKLGDNLLELLPDCVCCQVLPELVSKNKIVSVLKQLPMGELPFSLFASCFL